MSKKIIVLGAGLVGKTIASDLADDFDVVCADTNENALHLLHATGIGTEKMDFSDLDNLKRVIRPYDLVVGAVPGFMGFEIVKAVIEAKKDMVDISFFPEDAFRLDDLAKKNNTTIVTDCGVAPGMGNIFLGYHNKRMKIHSYKCLVGGLPTKREWPYEYKAPFSPIDVIEEYVRPARYIQNGGLVTREALSDSELVHFDKVGTLESWNSDGLRSLIHTMPHIPNMIEKTLRYPGTIAYLRLLRETGFFSHEEITVNGAKIKPIDMTARLLFPTWKLQPGEEEFTIMRVQIDGEEQGTQKKYQYDLFDQTDKKSGTSSMARTTGYTCTGAARLLLSGKFKRKGIAPPEYLGEDENNFRFILKHLKNRNVVCQTNQET